MTSRKCMGVTRLTPSIAARSCPNSILIARKESTKRSPRRVVSIQSLMSEVTLADMAPIMIVIRIPTVKAPTVRLVRHKARCTLPAPIRPSWP